MTQSEATCDPLDVLEGANSAQRPYWFDTYNKITPFHLSWTHNQCWSALTLQTREYIPLSTELEPDGFWTLI